VNVGDKMMSGRQVVTVEVAKPAPANGDVVVLNAAGFYVPMSPDGLTPVAETITVDTSAGRFEIEVPTNGDTETRATLLDPAVRG
jgi:hypothetical protein